MKKLFLSILALMSVAGTAAAQTGGGSAGPDQAIPVTLICTRAATLGSPLEVVREMVSNEAICKFEYAYYSKNAGPNQGPVGGTWETDISIPAGQLFSVVTKKFPADPKKYTVRVLHNYPIEFAGVPVTNGIHAFKNGTCKSVKNEFNEFFAPDGNQFAGSAYKLACERLYFEGK